MKHLLNTLYVTTQGSYLTRDGATVLVHLDQEEKVRLPVHTLGSIVCFGQVSCSPWLMALCAENNVAMSFFTERGQFLARVQGAVRGNVLLRREQYRRADDPKGTSAIVRSLVLAKVANCRTVVMRAARERSPDPELNALQAAAVQLAALLTSVEATSAVDSIRGLEGESARVYFSVFDHLITASKDSFFFRERNRRPPMDNVNALLSFLYTLLVHDVEAALEGVGLDPCVGFLHTDRPGRPSLALDLMEEFRPFLADRLALSLINRRQVNGAGFKATESGAVTMDDETRKTVLVAWQQRKQEEIQHPFLGEGIALGLLPHVQALLLARHLRGDLDAYPAFFWR